jgi:RimJ/RimL family protein N-acetyltransferase
MIAGIKIVLRDKRLTDALNDYTWLTDPELAHLDATPLLATTFQDYLSDYSSQLHYPSSIRHSFAIETLNGKHIGNCAYYGINKTKSEAEVGIMLGNHDSWDKGYGSDALTALVNHIFQQTNLTRLHLRTLKSNTRAQKCFQKCGFTPYGHRVKNGYSFILMEIHRRQ